ncbi:MAG: MBL fold metallo-hydrolase, partial [Oscillospiraceae bacterium]|nr:MBL fold metallo-hydrolase [Oscillospiraceae bacterium]
KLSIVDVDGLVAGHDGAGSSSCRAFLESVNPEHSVISVGKNNQYGHPSVFAIGRMNSEGINVLRTDLCGRVSFIIN